MSFIGGLVLAGVGGVLCGVTSTVLLNERAYRSALQADAVVVQKQMRRATSDSSTSYEVTYKVRSAEGEEWQKVDTVEAATWEGVEEGRTVPVEYLRGDSGSLRIARQARDVPLALVALVAALTGALALLGLRMASRGGREVWRKMRIYRHGQPAEAIVTAVRETNVSVNRRIQWVIDFTFRDHLGQAQQGTSAPMPVSEALEWQEGDKGIARFDPERPTDSVWVGE